jgi:DNA-directed RNA polymerase specialized sigma24 family protein
MAVALPASSAPPLGCVEPQIVYSRRDTEGAIWPIKVYEDPLGRRSFEIERADAPSRYSTVRATLEALHGRGYRSWGWDRYAGCGRYAPTPVVGEPGLTILEVATRPLEPGLQTIVVTAPRRGVDLEGRHTEVAKLLYAGFGAQIHASGYEFDDVLQEVFRKLVVSNQGKNPWNPSKSSFGHFVHMVCRSALYNLYRKDKRRRQHERLGGYTPRDGQWVAVDVADRGDLAAPIGSLEPPDEALHHLQAHLLQAAAQVATPTALRDAQVAVQALPYVRDGHGRQHIADVLGMKPSLVSRALAYLRTHARTWLH